MNTRRKNPLTYHTGCGGACGVVVSVCSERYSRRGSLEDVEYGKPDHFASVETRL
ncbi:hypothetical protein BDR06DRAFT_947835 [Suillus hirtellus]|nr:hypothetical protein BDR06DRAFT_947835 [Suillus hirtellus]